ncbi:M4 family metallopeptidase [Inhella gelatinilytica]|uniref:Neutral metalloproteinase n=1 Tax=Inhella gelatinilytica TaxID=2795030 RepID=A0A931ISN1_9BURK|nr:M4 family metallopeptidase [Inhella gelatinilytica]MBH9551409.1 M4 family metallopeptidase [Inhella gelatinilytica]
MSDMQKVFKRSALVIALAALSAPVLAAPDAEARARGHIESFAGYTMHGNGHAYGLRDVVTDADGGTHARFDRTFRGMRVIGGDLVVHNDGNGNFRGASHTLRHVINMSDVARITPAAAARAALAAHAGDTQGKPAEKVVYARGATPQLAYDVRVFGEQADGTPSEMHVIVDATNGAVLEMWNDIHTAAVNGTGKSLYSGTVSLGTNSLSSGYEMRDPSRGGIYTTNMNKKTSGAGTVFTDADNVWGNGTTSDLASAAVDAQYGTAVTWDYYKNVHGRTGIDGTGAKVAYNKVHYGRSYANAFWSDSCFCMTYGDGNSSIKPLVSLDVAGHEMTHGVTSRTANLTYSGESGGLNEATSDIFGSMVEFYANNTSDAGDYLIGEKIMVGKAFMRNMMQPSKDGVSADCWYSGLGSIDVHYSSGPANHMFFMLAEGTNSALGASKTCNAGDTKTATGNGSVTGIGRDAAGKIWYRALTVYMTSSTNYAGARVAALKAASDLYGAGSTQYNSVAAAFSAINVN